MMLETLIEQFGDNAVLMMAGGLVGVVFGVAAQHSRFCLRAATVELSEGVVGSRLAIWLIAFSAAVATVQGLIATGWLDVSEARQLANTGSLSGAIIGGLMFGVGMILARGCASRLLVLSATGNLRAILTGLVLTLVAQASLRGVVIAVSSITFTGPSTDTLMGLVNASELPQSFGVGLVPGVFIGAGGMALIAREAKIERFGPDTPMERYLLGAVLMGFGSMLAGGCAVGAGMSGGAVFAVTAWVAVFCMWVGASATHVWSLQRLAAKPS